MTDASAAGTESQPALFLLFLILCLLAPLAALFDRAAGYSACAAGVLIFASWPLLYREKPPLSKAAVYWMAALAALALASSLWALDQAVSLERALKIAPELVAGALLVGVMPRFAQKIPRQWLWLPPVFFALALCLLALDLYTGLPLYRHLHPQLAAKGSYPPDELNRSVLFCILLFPSMAGIVFVLPGLAHKRRLMLAGGLAVLALIVLFAAASQSAQLAFLLMAAAALLFPYRRPVCWYALAFVMAAVILATPWLAEAMFRHFAPWLAAQHAREISQAYMPNRLEIWDTVSRYALQSPWHGFGIDATRAVPAFDTQQIYQNDAKLPHPHNFAVQLWMEFGIIGALYGAGLLAAMLRFLMKQESRARQRIALPTLIGCLSAAAMTFSLWQGWWLGLLFLAAAMARFSMAVQPDAAAEPQARTTVKK
jgi:exopolysaccharide production protein ExoQ